MTVPEEEYNLYKEKEESNIEKVEAVIFRLICYSYLLMSYTYIITFLFDEIFCESQKQNLIWI